MPLYAVPVAVIPKPAGPRSCGAAQTLNDIPLYAVPGAVHPKPAWGALGRRREPPTREAKYFEISGKRNKIRNFPRPRPKPNLWPITGAPDPIPGPGPQAEAPAPGLGPWPRTGAENCNPYNTLAHRVSKNAAPTTRWGPGVRKLQPLQHFGAPGLENCNPYNTLEPRGLEIAAPTTLWEPPQPGGKIF